MFPERLKSLRLSMGATQKEMAEFLGISRAAYGNYEVGQSEPNIENLKKLAHFFNVSLDYLISGEEGKKVCASETVEINEDEYKSFLKLKKYSFFFHDLTNATESKKRQITKIWGILKEDS